MSDKIPSPTIRNEVRQNNFTLVILAYRKITKEEALTVAAQWLKSNRRKSFPKTGSATVITMIGFDH